MAQMNVSVRASGRRSIHLFGHILADRT